MKKLVIGIAMALGIAAAGLTQMPQADGATGWCLQCSGSKSCRGVFKTAGAECIFEDGRCITWGYCVWLHDICESYPNPKPAGCRY